MKCLFPAPHLKSICVLCPKVGLLQAGFYGLLFFTQSVTLCLLIGAFSSLAFEVATQPSILACRIPWTEEPGKLQSIGSQRVGHDLATKQIQMLTDIKGETDGIQ